MDKYTSFFIWYNKFIHKWKKKLVFILAELTSILQPLDVSCNNLFKLGIINEYINFTIKNKSNKKINKDLILVGLIKFGFQMNI